MNQMTQSIFKMYSTLELGKNKICQECKKENTNGFSKPISVWHVGDKFHDNNYKVLFVGKVARGELYPNVNDYERHGIIDATAFGKDSLSNPFSAFWNYTREISVRLFGQKDAIDNIAMTNLIKCNNAMDDEGRNSDGTTSDYTTVLMKNNCLKKIGVFWKEIDVLMPKNIVVYSHYEYDDYLRHPNSVQTQKEVTNQPRTIGQKKMRWWDRELVMHDGRTVRLLVVSHPQYLLKDDFVNKIVSWIKNQPV
ncbi:MAG: hypothetical protein IPM89_04945 [Candidatus Competibacteraceae bacterium]|nr:MAG: hypothetical protein IPM89_04945 [Candidatus Competibacteraceae bacterium]